MFLAICALGAIEGYYLQTTESFWAFNCARPAKRYCIHTSS